MRGIERYITMAAEGGARPVIVLNKSDLCEDKGQALAEAGIYADVRCIAAALLQERALMS